LLLATSRLDIPDKETAAANHLPYIDLLFGDVAAKKLGGFG